MFHHTGLVQFESRIAKSAILGHALARALQRVGSLDSARRHEIVHLHEIAARPCERDANTSVWTSSPHLTRHFRPRASRTDRHGCDPVVCSSTKWNGGAGAPSRPPAPAARSRLSAWARIAPDGCAARLQRGISRGSASEVGSHAPEKKNEPRDDDGADGDAGGDKNQFCRRHLFRS